VGTLHLTLGVMSLSKDDGLGKAVALLQNLKPREIWASIELPRMPGQATGAGSTAPGNGKNIAPPPLPGAVRDSGDEPRITLRGLQSMQPASKTSVLYAPPVDQLGTLQKFCEALRDVFQQAGLMVQENRPLLLHATVLNTVYVKGGSQGGRQGPRGRRGDKLTIDAQLLLDRYEDEVWMQDVQVEKIAICRMGAKKTEVDGVEDETYEEVASAHF